MQESKRRETILLLIWTQALIALFGSLYFSEIKGYTPCELCWVQRIFMYPLVIIYGLAAWNRSLSIALPGAVLSGIGAVISGYHYLVQQIPSFQSVGGSCGTVPCNAIYEEYFGFITIPFMAGVAFMMICLLHLSLIISGGRSTD